MVRRMLFVGFAVALLGAAPAAADPEPGDGIKHAKEAGIYVDPAIEPFMEQAPIGSCVNDPTWRRALRSSRSSTRRRFWHSACRSHADRHDRT
jgi:hypothetical protein